MIALHALPHPQRTEKEKKPPRTPSHSLAPILFLLFWRGQGRGGEERRRGEEPHIQLLQQQQNHDYSNTQALPPPPPPLEESSSISNYPVRKKKNGEVERKNQKTNATEDRPQSPDKMREGKERKGRSCCRYCGNGGRRRGGGFLYTQRCMFHAKPFKDLHVYHKNRKRWPSPPSI